jgi:hypothetical protein
LELSGISMRLPGRLALDDEQQRRSRTALFYKAALLRLCHLQVRPALRWNAPSRIQTVLNPDQAVVHRRDVVRRLLRVAEGDTGCRVGLEKKQIRQRRLRPLDLRRKNRFLADVGTS